ncbi:hypothetical protein MKX01_036191 [Papaver californicum]|nr:hypothetical protein MKX01_036191 [Papaver californicum]
MPGRGRKWARNTSNTRGSGKALNVVEMIRLMTEEMTNQTAAIMDLIQNHNRNHNAPPPPRGMQMTERLNLLEKFIRLKPPTFEGSTDPLVVDKWKEDMDKVFVAMRYTQVQRQQLVVFQLSGKARKWKNKSIELDLDTVTYIQFCECLDTRYFPTTIRTKKIKEFVDVGQIRGELVDDYLDRYISLSCFAIFMILDEEKFSRKFEQGLGDRSRNKVICHCFLTFQQVVESARATEASG